MEYDLIVKNGQVVTSETTVSASVLVKDGKFAGIVTSSELPAARQVYDATGQYVLPGVIDEHVHFRDPGLTYKEDFGTGSLAAAHGGITTVVDMPNVVPPTSDVAGFQAKLAQASKKSYVDFGIIGVVLEENMPGLSALADAGIVGFKIFMGETVGKLPSPSDGGIIEAMKIIAKTGLRVGVHAEDNSIIKYYTDKLKAEGRTDPVAFVESRPNAAEAECIARAILFAKVADVKLHICHVSSKEGVSLVQAARARGQDVTAETCPHYLLLDYTHMAKVGSLQKINPPVRSKEDQAALWQGIGNDTFAAIATDHSPHTLEEKTKEIIWDAVSGFCGVETSVALMLTEVNKGRMTLNQYVKLSSEGPARTFNMYPKKGSLQIGSDADLTIVDMNKEGVIKMENLHSKNQVTPFEGFKVKGMPVATIVRGNIVMRDGKVEGAPQGKLVRPIRSDIPLASADTANRHESTRQVQIREMAHDLFVAGCVRFGQFTLKSGAISPIYLDFRRLVSYPSILRRVGHAYANLVRELDLQFDHLAGIPYAGLPVAIAMSMDLNRSLIFPRREVKDYGTRSAIEGNFESGDTVIVIDDLATSGDTKIEAIARLESAGLVVRDVVVLIDREQGAGELLAAKGYALHSVVPLRDLLEEWKRVGDITPNQYEEARDYLKLK